MKLALLLVAALVAGVGGGHGRIRSLIRERYGFRDRWVNLFVDTSGSVAVQLVAAE